MRQECKDFKIVFIQKKDASSEEKHAILYACGFASAVGQSGLIVVVTSEEEAPKAKMTKILKDTSILPANKMEVLKMRTEASKQKIEDQKIEKLKKKAEQNIETKNTIENKQVLVEKDNATNTKMMLQQKLMKDEVYQKKEAEKIKDTKPIEKVFFKIVVPNYNNMAYIKKCLDSILEQTFQDFKIIVVDDLSTDGSDKFCEAYARKHPNKIVFLRLKEKGFAGAARNLAIDYPLDCKYIWAIDGDDFIASNNALSILYKHARSLKYDAIFFNGFYNRNGKIFELPARKNVDLSNNANADPTYHTCRIVKQQYFSRYLENCMIGQDIYHSYMTLDSIKTYLNLMQHRLYVYRYNSNSVSNKTQNIDQIHIREQHRKYFLSQLQQLQHKIKNPCLLNDLQNRIHLVQKRISVEQEKEDSRRKIVVAMASFPLRKVGMLNTIQALLPQCDIFCLWLNEYDEIPAEIKDIQKQSSKLIVKIAKQLSCLKENGRYTWISQYQNAYYLTVDDDIQYPSTYVNNMVAKINQYNSGKSIVSYHGTIFDQNKEIYFPFSATVQHDVQVHRVGGGVMGFIPSKIGLKSISIDELKTWDGDASISVWATKHRIKKYVIAHSISYLKQFVDPQTKTKVSTIRGLCFNASTAKKRKRIYAQLNSWEKVGPI